MSKTQLEPETVEQNEALAELVAPSEILGRSPGQIFWRRFRKDKLAFVGVFILIIIVALALAAPLFARLLDHSVNSQYVFEMTTPGGVPLGPTTSNEAGVFLFGLKMPERRSSPGSGTFEMPMAVSPLPRGASFALVIS
ncbi:MAG: hypothetical protein WD186_03755 [Actinomycetota bacterium]